MAASLDVLVPEFRPAADELLFRLGSRGIVMRPNETLRDPFKQARFWRQSRSRETIGAKVRELRDAGAGFLAFCLESVGPQHGRHVTNALPGLSWHQWGEALDCFWLVDGRAEWSENRFIDGVNGFREYAATARAMGLTAGGFFTSFKDFPHVQLRPAASPRSLFSLREIDDVMERRFA